MTSWLLEILIITIFRKIHLVVPAAVGLVPRVMILHDIYYNFLHSLNIVNCLIFDYKETLFYPRL